MSTRLLAALLAMLAVPACAVSPRTVHHVGSVASSALWTAAVVGQVSIVAYHDAHHHDERCGHFRHFRGQRWVYYYGDRWEYYDEPSARWYVYAD